MCYDGVPHASLTVYREIQDRLILLDGWSKTYAMTGWRLGYAVWPQELVEHATRLAINIHSCVNAATQWAGIEALQGPQDAVDRMVAAFDERRKVILERLNALPGFHCVRPGGAFYAFPNITGTGLASRALQDRLLNDAGVALVSGTSFGDEGEGYIRFSYANSIANIEEAIDRIARFLER
jgi:aspartate/methionine/tyrosine aminotransferase